MLPNLLIENYRGIRNLEVSRLGKLNLLLGKNSSGKSSVLEALRLFASGGARSTVEQIVAVHDEDVGAGADDEQDELSGEQVLRHLFPDRIIPQNGPFALYVGDAGRASFVRFDLRQFLVEEDIQRPGGDDYSAYVVRRRRYVEDGQLLDLPTGRLGRGISVQSDSSDSPPLFFDLDRPWRAKERAAPVEDEPRYNSSFVSTRFLSPSRLARLWDSVALRSGEADVVQALQIIDKSVEAVAFLEAVGRRVAGNRRIPYAKLRHRSQPVPVNSMGEGVLRLFQLALAAHSAKGGYLFIDEFENGLHYSVQETTWRFIAEIAAREDVQVFATTHSLDCIRAFASVVKSRPEEGVAIRIDRDSIGSERIPISPLNETDLATLLGSDVEIR
jgi:AAA domain, putative AbiEii toxin, Type IV TA system